jgi:hypothetical protein
MKGNFHVRFLGGKRRGNPSDPADQSTVNNNMPLRLLQYINSLYQGMIDHRTLFQKKLIEIPAPEFIVLYNGEEPYPERKEIRLSEAFKSTEGLRLPKNGSVSLELVAHVYNINYGNNTELLKKNETLNGYSFFISKIREFNRKNPLEKAVIEAVKYCIDHNVLKSYLQKHSTEVLNMLIEEITIEDEMAAAKEDGREEAIEEIARNALSEGASFEFVQKITGLDPETIKNLQV